jgi:uncharacterized protein (TIGR03089 family)
VPDPSARAVATFPRAAAAGLDQPLLTYYDDATGERTELSAAQLSGWASRTAGLLHDGCGLAHGDRVAVLLPPHWQTAAVLLGAWSAGLAVSFRLAATAGLVGCEPFDAVFVSSTRLDDWLEDVPEAPHRFVLGLAQVPARVPDGYRDFIAEVGRYSDALPAYAPLHRDFAATVDGTTFREWGGLGQALAERLDLYPGDRLLIDAGEHEHPVTWLLAPLAAGASVVLCANLDPSAVEARVAAEHVTRVLD